MNYLIVTTKDGKELKSPFFKKAARVMNDVTNFLQIKKEEVEKIEMVIDGVRQNYSYAKFPKFVDNSTKEQLTFFKDEIKTTKQLDMMMDTYKDFHLFRDILKLGTFERLLHSKNKLSERKQYKKYKFSTITQIKANGKVKQRYICVADKYTISPLQKEIKDTMEKLVTLEPEMLGLGAGVKNSIEFFNDFETIVKIDFKDFFNQTTYKMLVKGLREHSVINNDSVIKSIAEACCPYSPEKRSRTAWQGLSTSTIAAYIAVLSTFKKVKKHLKENYDTVPVIYIDDLAFGIKGDRALAEKAKREVMAIIKKNGYVLNKEKCKVLFGNKTFFLGINMNTKKLGTNSYVKNLKAALYNYSTHKITNKNRKYIQERGYGRLDHSPSRRKMEKKELQVLMGKLNYLKMINEDSYNTLLNHQKYGKIIKELAI